METKKTLTWDVDINILLNRFVMKQIYFACLISWGFLLIVVSLINLSSGLDSLSEYIESILPIIYVGVGLFASIILVVIIFFTNRYPFTFILDSKDACMLTRKEQRKRNNIISTLLILLGIITGKPGAVGTGMINKNNNDRIISWKNVNIAKLYSKQNTILLKGGPFEYVYLFCSEDNFNEAVDFVQNHIKKEANLQWLS